MITLSSIKHIVPFKIRHFDNYILAVIIDDYESDAVRDNDHIVDEMLELDTTQKNALLNSTLNFAILQDVQIDVRSDAFQVGKFGIGLSLRSDVSVDMPYDRKAVIVACEANLNPIVDEMIRVANLQRCVTDGREHIIEVYVADAPQFARSHGLSTDDAVAAESSVDALIKEWDNAMGRVSTDEGETTDQSPQKNANGDAIGVPGATIGKSQARISHAHSEQSLFKSASRKMSPLINIAGSIACIVSAAYVIKDRD